MPDHSRINDLRKRVEADPHSIAFAQLAEECRRAGLLDEAVAVCQKGLAVHGGYLSARVTLGRALLELGQLDAAQAELETVLASAPENLAAIRGLADIFHRRGTLPEALAQYRAALALAKNDPDLQQTVADLARRIEPQPKPASVGLTFEQAKNEFLQIAPPPPRPPSPPAAASERPGPEAAPVEPPKDDTAERTVATLESFLAAVHGSRADRGA